jgi:LmbE family N-acetylglucosaminyl deacetylase
MVVAAHPDDESIGASAWLLRASAAVVILTDGVQRDPRWFGRGHAWNAALYGQVRRRECRAALAALGVPAGRIVHGRIPDQELGYRLQDGLRLLQAAARRFRPQVVLVPAWEGGHPDHDTANFLVACLRQERLAPTVRHWWEYPLYTLRNGRIAVHDLPAGAGSRASPLRADERQRRRRAVAAYRSQAQTLDGLVRIPECWRPLPEHDYTRPPLAGPTVYEQWGMPWTAPALCRAFQVFRMGTHHRGLYHERRIGT